MKVTIKQLRQSLEAFKVLTGLTGLPANTHLRVVLTLKAVQGPIDACDTAYTALASRYGEAISDKPGAYKITDVKAFTEEAEVLLKEEVEIDCKKIPFASIAGRISAKHVVALDWLIDIPPDQDDPPTTSHG